MIRVIHTPQSHFNVLAAPQMGSVLPGGSVSTTFTFTEESKYYLRNSDQYDISKLFGIAAHTLESERNSYRFGWWYDDILDKFMVIPFIHKDDGSWYTLEPFECLMNSRYRFKITTSGEFTIRSQDNKLLYINQAKTKLPFRLWYRKMVSYFGGDRTPDRIIHIYD